MKVNENLHFMCNCILHLEYLLPIYYAIFFKFCWPCISVYLTQYLTNLMHKICFAISFISCLYMFRALCARHQEVKNALHSLWYHHTYRCDDTRGCVIQFWPPDDEHMCSKHVEAWNKLIVRQKFCASSWLITEIKIQFFIVINYCCDMFRP